MISTTWLTTPAPFAGAFTARPTVVGPLLVAAGAPVRGTGVPSARLRPQAGGALCTGATTDELHVQHKSTKNDPILGIHSPGRPLS